MENPLLSQYEIDEANDYLVMFTAVLKDCFGGNLPYYLLDNEQAWRKEYHNTLAYKMFGLGFMIETLAQNKRVWVSCRPNMATFNGWQIATLDSTNDICFKHDMVYRDEHGSIYQNKRRLATRDFLSYIRQNIKQFPNHKFAQIIE